MKNSEKNFYQGMSYEILQYKGFCNMSHKMLT